MRTHEEIEEEAVRNFKNGPTNYAHGKAILEVLLDIRDILSQEKKRCSLCPQDHDPIEHTYV